MTVDLDLETGIKYSLIALIFFIPYIIFQFPSTAVLRHLGPRLFLGGTTLAWGITMIGMGFAKSWTTLVGLRFILGLFEAGSYPGSIYLISTWCRFKIS
jgi:MFS family permease